MKITKTPEPVMVERWAKHRTRLRRRLTETRPSLVRAEEAAAMLDRREMVFRGRKFSVPPVPWPVAVRLLNAQADLSQAAANKDATTESAVDAYTRAVAAIKEAVTPVSRVRRLFWRFTRNPWQNASPQEVGYALGFCLTCLALGEAQSPTETHPHGS